MTHVAQYKHYATLVPIVRHRDIETKAYRMNNTSA